MFRATVLFALPIVSALFDEGTPAPPVTPLGIQAPPPDATLGLIPDQTTTTEATGGPKEQNVDMSKFDHVSAIEQDDLPPMPTYEAVATGSPSPFEDVDVNAAKQALTGLGAELNDKYDQYHNQPEVFAHHTALLKAKHVILQEKEATMKLIKSTWHKRCDVLDAQWDDLKAPIQAKIDAAKATAKEEADKKYHPEIEAAKHEHEVQDTAVVAKFAALKQKEQASLKTALAAEDADFAAKVQQIKQQAAAARGNAVEARADTTPASHHVLAFGIVALAGFAIVQASGSRKVAEESQKGQYGTL